jgi:hypothetical protein
MNEFTELNPAVRLRATAIHEAGQTGNNREADRSVVPR